jgi:predicted transcriptional regulator
MVVIATEAADQRVLVLRDAVREVLTQRDEQVAAMKQRFERRLAEVAETSEQQHLILQDAMAEFVADELRERDEQMQHFSARSLR